MKTLSLVLALAVVASAEQADYVAHEWGTFTSMQGSDGITLEGLQHEEESLPGFVYSRTEVRECPLRDHGYKGLEVDVDHVTKKMETPVIYFYADAPLRVRTRVCFNNGLLTQWYPVSDLLGPAEMTLEQGPLDMAKVGKSYLEWETDILKRGEGLNDIPTVETNDPWSLARIPDSNCVRTVERRRPRLGPVETEKYIFYRGLGRFDLPFKVQAEGGSRLRLVNDGDEPIRHVFVLRVTEHVLDFDYIPEVAAGSSQEACCAITKRAKRLAPGVEALRKELEAKLMECGLYAKEAEAMTRTWERSYFHTEGVRLLYIVPPAAVERILPLAFEPAPKELVRVLVGRMEVITPEVEKEVTAALKDWRSADASVQAAARQRLERLGRFLEPHLRRVLALTKDATVIANAETLLRQEKSGGGDSIPKVETKKRR